MAYSIGGEPILIRSAAAEDGSPESGSIAAHTGGSFRYLGESDVTELKWFLPVLGGGGAASTPANPKVRLVQPKELFPACEYKTIQDVYGGTLEYSGDGTDWIPACSINIIGGRRTLQFPSPDAALTPHQYWRVNLKGFSKPEDPNDPDADRGFYTFGRLWEALFWVERHVEQSTGNYTMTAGFTNWQVNGTEPVTVSIAISPSVSNGELFYKPNTGDWQSCGSFSSTQTVLIPTEDLIDGNRGDGTEGDGRPQTAAERMRKLRLFSLRSSPMGWRLRI